MNYREKYIENVPMIDSLLITGRNVPTLQRKIEFHVKGVANP